MESKCSVDIALSYDAGTSAGPPFLVEYFLDEHVVTVKGSERLYKGELQTFKEELVMWNLKPFLWQESLTLKMFFQNPFEH